MNHADPRRILADRAVARVTSLFQESGHVVQKIDGHNDFGEDIYVSFNEARRPTGSTIAVQVKGGSSYRSARGYRVRVKQHGESWRRANAPVVCVVYDPGTDLLCWANASEQLRYARDRRSIEVRRTDVLDAASVAAFVQRMRRYIAGAGGRLGGADDLEVVAASGDAPAGAVQEVVEQGESAGVDRGSTGVSG
ncbi:DUF4365 domain-containing protein [Actinokineospora cianjurensis]|uniref:Uncharacterized protein DUF4365 n=1 Tax=Actinokineospora cianjurensis TaxID=585224 RepID=A0A421B7R9_9PSEU|nr:DUF4365 domain-containing protein [Actinokineospora cianjurensis]RLK60417.1 uncharacterized protein DUF4365 [Actinokineospora cianjurensis]